MKEKTESCALASCKKSLFSYQWKYYEGRYFCSKKHYKLWKKQKAEEKENKNE